MAKANRFTRVQPAQYNPMGLEELMMVPMMKRQQHDELLNNVATTQAELAQVDYMDMHSEKVLGLKQKLQDELSRQVEEVSANGISNSLRSDFTNLNSKYQEAIGPKGDIGRAALAKQQFQAEKEAFMVNSTKQGYSPEDMALNWEDHVRENYSGFDADGNITNIDALYSPNYKNVVDEFNALAANAGMSSEDIMNATSNIVFDRERGSYVLTREGRDALASNEDQLNAVDAWIEGNLNNPNSDLAKSIAHQRKSPEDALAEIQGLSQVYAKEDKKTARSEKISGYSPAAEVGVVGHEGNLNYEAEEAENIKLYDESTINRIDNIINEVDANPSYATDGGFLLNLLGLGTEKDASTVENKFNEKEIEALQSEYERIQENTPSLKDTEFGTKESLKALKEYKSKNLDLLRQNMIITDDYITEYGDNSIGTKASDNKSIKEAVLNSAQFRKYEIDGEVYTYEELPDNIKENFNNKGLHYSGYYSPKNFLAYSHGKNENKNMFASPLAMAIYDEDSGERINMRVSRSEGEMSKPSYKADQMFNDVFVNVNAMPNLPYKVPGSNGKVEVEYNPSTRGYTIYRVGDSGERQSSRPMSSDALQAAFYKMNGVDPNSNKQ